MRLLFSGLPLVGCVLLSGGVIAGDAVSTGGSLPEYPPPRGDKCVEPADVMRRQHMEFILHQRDETVYGGIRGVAARHSLKDCIDCHAGYDDKGKAVAIDAKGQFCESCHAYTAVSIDCFGCHRATPTGDNAMRKTAVMR